jgi:hypothetical protein
MVSPQVLNFGGEPNPDIDIDTGKVQVQGI